MEETLRDQVGPYGQDVETLKRYLLQRAEERKAEGWTLVSVEYRQELYPTTSQYRYIAYPVYERKS